MGKGLLAQWRRRIVARGLAGAILFAVPVAVAAALGFGTSLSGVAGGLSSIAEGPDELATADALTTGKLNRAVAAAARSNEASRLTASREGAGGGDGSDLDGSSNGSTGDGGVDEGDTSGAVTDTGSAINPPGIDLPGGGNGGGSGGGGGGGVEGTVNDVGESVNGALTGVGNTVDGLLGGQ